MTLIYQSMQVTGILGSRDSENKVSLSQMIEGHSALLMFNEAKRMDGFKRIMSTVMHAAAPESSSVAMGLSTLRRL